VPYVLVTGILARAVDGDINPLALQARAPIKGSYDARSLCHKVLVPFERDFLENVLGGSNEPFLNKPARFTHLSKSNAVRRGRDQETLFALISTLESICDTVEAKQILACVFSYLRKISEEKRASYKKIISSSTSLCEIVDFSRKFLSKSQEGETLAVIVGSLERIFYKRVSDIYSVTTHKVNQSGASSKEIGDVDVYNRKEHYFSIEAKDKSFTAHDASHAFKKAFSSGASKAMFVYGENAKFSKKEIEELIISFEEQGFFVLIQSIDTYMTNVLFRISNFSIAEFGDAVLQTLQEINCKQETLDWFNQLVEEHAWRKNKT